MFGDVRNGEEVKKSNVQVLICNHGDWWLEFAKNLHSILSDCKEKQGHWITFDIDIYILNFEVKEDKIQLYLYSALLHHALYAATKDAGELAWTGFSQADI